MIGVERAFTENTLPIQDSELSFEPTQHIKEALKAQHIIGWTNFYRGRISKNWLVEQDKYASTKNNRKQDTDQWATQITTTLWHGFLLLWEERKQDQHGRDKIQQQATTRHNLLKRTRQLYSKLHL